MDFFDPSTLKAVSTRRHVKGNRYQLATRQYPADCEFQMCEYEDAPPNDDTPDDARHPADEIELRGGNGEPVYIAHLKENSLMEEACICVGFQLVSVKYIEDERQVTDPNFYKKPPHEILKGLPLPITLCCLSPLAKLPSFSEREIAQKLGIRQIKEVHLRRLTDALQLRWLEVTLPTRFALTDLQEAIDDSLVLTKELDISGGRGMDRAGVKQNAYLKPGFILKDVTTSGTKITKDNLSKLKAPLNVQIGMKRNTEAIEKIPFNIFNKAVDEAGIHWLFEEQRRELHQAISVRLRMEQEDINRDKKGWEDLWQEELADTFVFDMVSDQSGKNKSSCETFVHIGRPIKANHVLAITRLLQARFKQKQEDPTVKDGDEDLKFSDFEKAFTLGGVTWLGREHIKILYRAISGDTDGSGGISLLEWMSCFAWSPSEAAVEIQRHLEVLAKADHKSFHNTYDQMTLKDFQNELFNKKINWLTTDQQEVLFKTIDASGDGKVDKFEWDHIAKLRQQLEEKWENEKIKEEEEKWENELRERIKAQQEQQSAGDTAVAAVADASGGDAATVDAGGGDAEVAAEGADAG